jgi:UDP-glucose 4-epimerase
METDEKQKLVVVTGGAGFVGSHLCERLVKEGYAVISLDNYFTGTPDNHVPGVAYRTGHTKDIATHITETPDIIFHLGEYARTEKSFEDIEQVWDLNKTGTFAVLEFCRQRNCKIIYAGSSTKFADAGEGRDQSPYAWTKASNTELVENYARWFGPREMSGPYGTLIRIFSELYRHGQPFTITAPGTQTRNFTHVYDIVDGLILVGEKGRGDGYGIGADQSYSVMEVADMFGGEKIIMPERAGNRLTSGVDNIQVKALGWTQKHQLKDWIASVKTEVGTVAKADQKILVFSTTFLPLAGAAEYALYDVCKTLPNVHFDIITTAFGATFTGEQNTLPNVTVHRVGNGNKFDKWLLPILGAGVAKKLLATNSYLFRWSLFASYAAVTALFSAGKKDTPLLITLADQSLAEIPVHTRLILKPVLQGANQVFAIDANEGRAALSVSARTTLITSIGQGDAFANQIRVAYTHFLKQRLKK